MNRRLLAVDSGIENITYHSLAYQELRIIVTVSHAFRETEMLYLRYSRVTPNSPLMIIMPNSSRRWKDYTIGCSKQATCPNNEISLYYMSILSRGCKETGRLYHRCGRVTAN